MRFIILLLCLLLPTMSWASNNEIKTLVIEISGLNPEETIIIGSNLTIKKAEKEKNPSKDRIIAFHELASKEIKTCLETLGYYHPKIEAKLIRTNTGYLAHYDILSGPPVIVNSLTLKIMGQGGEDPKLNDIITHSPILIGTTLRHNQYETYKHALMSTALQLGYLDAVYETNEIRLDTQKNLADIYLILDTGKQFSFGEISYKAPPFPTEYLDRYIPFCKGSPYSTEQLTAYQKALTDSDLFSKVRIDPELNETKGFEVPLKVRLKRKPRNKYLGSVGFGTNTGLRGQVGWEHSRTHYPGHRIITNAKASKRINQLNAQYIIPGRRPSTDRLAFGTQITQELPSDHKYSLRQETGVTQLQKWGHLEQILGLHFRSEVYKQLPTSPKQSAHFIMPSIGYTWSSIRKKTLLQNGTRASCNLRGALKPIFSTSNFIQADAHLKTIIPIGSLTRIIARTELGATATSNVNDIPLSLRFFTGGDHSVRGYGFQSLGPTEVDGNGNVITVGGRFLFVGSLEVEQKIYKNIAGAIFVDTGNAFNKWGTSLATGAGFGARYETPLGPLRVDIAWPLRKGSHKPRVHINFGMDL